MPDLAGADSAAEAEDSVVAVLEGGDLVAEGSAVVALEGDGLVAEEVSVEANSEVEGLGVETLAEGASAVSVSLVAISEPDEIGAPVVVQAALAKAATFPVTARTSSRGTEEWISDSRTARTGAVRISKIVRTGVVKISRIGRTGVVRISKIVKMHMMTTGMITGMAPTIPVAAGTDGVGITVDWLWALA